MHAPLLTGCELNYAAKTHSKLHAAFMEARAGCVFCVCLYVCFLFHTHIMLLYGVIVDRLCEVSLETFSTNIICHVTSTPLQEGENRKNVKQLEREAKRPKKRLK